MMALKNFIFCANCLHCKVFKGEDSRGRAELRIKCAKNQWRTSSGKNPQYSYRRVLNRRMVVCPHYDSMGDATRAVFLRDLAAEIAQLDKQERAA